MSNKAQAQTVTPQEALREKFEACYPPPQYAVTANGLEVAKAIYYGQREYRDRWEGFQKGWQAASESKAPQQEEK